jgi:hypothetical protein
VLNENVLQAGVPGFASRTLGCAHRRELEQVVARRITEVEIEQAAPEVGDGSGVLRARGVERCEHDRLRVGGRSRRCRA